MNSIVGNGSLIKRPTSREVLPITVLAQLANFLLVIVLFAVLAHLPLQPSARGCGYR